MILLCSCFILTAARCSSDATVERLSQAPLFAFGGVGFASARTEGEKDYETILARSAARSDFERVFQCGNPQGKAYALVALRTLDVTSFRKHAAELRVSNVIVTTARGCLYSKQPIRTVISNVEGGMYKVYAN